MPISLLFFIYGLFIGSFLNMLIDRLPRGEQIFTGRSHCDKCKKDLKWYDLLPVFSWIILSGKCRFCRSPIPFRNCLVELLTGSLFFLFTFYAKVPISWENVLNLLAVGAFIVIFFVDLDHYYIAFEAEAVIGAAALINMTLIYLTKGFFGILPYLLSGIAAFLLFLFLHLATNKKGMGFGDVTLAFVLGIFLGWPKILSGLYVSFLTGAIVGVILILTGKKKFGQKIPFGPFLIFGAITALLAGEKIIRIISGFNF